MRRCTPRALPALLIGFALPAAVAAQPAPAPPPVSPPPAPAATAAPAPTAPVPNSPEVLAVPAAPGAPAAVVVPNGVYYPDPYHVATPYNPGVVGQPVPNPAWNRPISTLPCIYPNQNFEPFVPTQHWGKGWLKKGGCNGGCGGASGGGCSLGYPCGEGPNPNKQKWLHPECGMCSKGGSATTICNTLNFTFASSRSYFGESSREFFERPPSPDGIKMKPEAYRAPPAPAAYTPAYIVVGYVELQPKQGTIFPNPPPAP